MAASDEAEMTSARAMVKVPYPHKEQRAGLLSTGGPEKKTAVLNANHPVERYPTTAMILAVTSRPSSTARRPGATGWRG